MIGDVGDPSVKPDQEADPAGGFRIRRAPRSQGIGDSAIGVGEQGEIELVFIAKLLVTGDGIETDISFAFVHRQFA